MIFGAFLAIFNQTIMTVAIPELMDDFHIQPATAQWLTTGYMLVNGVLIPITAFFMRRFTTRQLFQSAMIIFLAGTSVAALATSFPVLLMGRMIQAAGAGIIMPLLMHVVMSLFPPEKRGTAMGWVGFAIIFAPAIGPTLAGYVLQTYPWQTMFYTMIPFTLLVIIGAFFYLKNVSETNPIKVDVLSVLLSTIGFGGILFGFSEAGNKGWISNEVVLSLMMGALGLALFIWRQLVSKNPLLDLRTFTYNMFSLTSIISILVTIVMYADMMLLPLYLQNTRGFTPLESGLLLFPGALLMGVLSPVTGKIFDRFGGKWLSVIGMAIIIATTYSFINLTDSTSYTYLVLMSTGRRVGMAVLMMPLQTTGLNQLPRSLYAHGNAISNTIRMVAGGIGTSLLVTIMASSTKNHFQEMMTTGAATGQSQQHMMMEASIQGINDAYLVIFLIGLISLVLTFFIKRVERAPEKKSEVTMDRPMAKEA
ncbi:MAG TPA: MFS transporter [Paenibacillaceae bacterium]|nr:MFS transporter [Paenibacillaceae bacterium]